MHLSTCCIGPIWILIMDWWRWHQAVAWHHIDPPRYFIPMYNILFICKNNKECIMYFFFVNDDIVLRCCFHVLVTKVYLIKNLSSQMVIVYYLWFKKLEWFFLYCGLPKLIFFFISFQFILNQICVQLPECIFLSKVWVVIWAWYSQTGFHICVCMRVRSKGLICSPALTSCEHALDPHSRWLLTMILQFYPRPF